MNKKKNECKRKDKEKGRYVESNISELTLKSETKEDTEGVNKKKNECKRKRNKNRQKIKRVNGQ